MLLIFFPVSFWIAGLLRGVYAATTPFLSSQILCGVYLGTYMFWLLAQFSGYATNDSYDATKLLIYPVTSRQILLGAIAGSLLDMPTLFLLPVLIVGVIAFAASPLSATIGSAAAVLFLFHVVTLSQSILLIGAGVLKSRRYRDLAIVLVSLCGMGYYIVTRLLVDRASSIDWYAYLHSLPWRLVQLLPPGCAAQATIAAHGGQVWSALGWLTLLGLYASTTLWLAACALDRVERGELSAVGRRRARSAGERVRAETSSTESTSLAWLQALNLPVAIEAMAQKELRYLARDPYFKLTLASLAYVLVAVPLGMYEGRDIPYGALRGVVVWTVTMMLLLMETPILCNQLGLDGPAVATLFAYPASRRDMLLAKNLVFFVVFALVNTALIALMAFFTRSTGYLWLEEVWTLFALVVVIAAGNFFSIYFPNRVVIRGMRVRAGALSARFTYLLLYMLMLAGAAIVLAPVSAALLLPAIFHAAIWYCVAIPLSLAYVAGGYFLSLPRAAEALEQREPRIVAKLSLAD